MRAKTKQLFDQLDSISFEFMDEPIVSSYKEPEPQNEAFALEDDYFDYYSDRTSSPQSSRDSYSRSLHTSILDVLSQFDSFRGKRDNALHELQSSSYEKLNHTQQEQLQPPMSDREPLQHFNHDRFQKDLRILKSSNVNNRSILECMSDMAINDHESIMTELQAFVDDIQNSIPNNTFILDLKTKLR